MQQNKSQNSLRLEERPSTIVTPGLDLDLLSPTERCVPKARQIHSCLTSQRRGLRDSLKKKKRVWNGTNEKRLVFFPKLETALLWTKVWCQSWRQHCYGPRYGAKAGDSIAMDQGMAPKLEAALVLLLIFKPIFIEVCAFHTKFPSQI